MYFAEMINFNPIKKYSFVKKISHLMFQHKISYTNIIWTLQHEICNLYQKQRINYDII